MKPKKNPKSKLIDFAAAMRPSFTWGWHHHLIADFLDKFRTGEIKRAMIFLPPQHGKSEFTSRLFPAHCFGNNPDARIILGSYASSLAKGFNRDIQRYMDNSTYSTIFPDTFLPEASDNNYQRNTERFDIVSHDGYLMSTGVDGGMTGNRADMLIIDDPHKNRREACDPHLSEQVYEWYKEVAKTRTHNNSGILLVQTRWDVNDLAGRLLKRMNEAIASGDEDADRWEILCLPAIKENNDNPQDPRQIGEALWPEMHDIRSLRDIRGESLRTFQHMYQQNPAPVQAGGECYKQFDYNKNTGTHHYNPDLPLHLSFDFNVNPYMSCTVWQIQNGDERGKLLPLIQGLTQGAGVAQPKPEGLEAEQQVAVLLEEICLRSPDNSTMSVCEFILNKYAHLHRSTTYIYGDPTGMREDTRSQEGHNDYAIIKRALAPLMPQFRINKKAPSVYMRILFMNALFAGTIKDLTISLDKTCQKTIDDFLYIKEEANGTKQKIHAIDSVTGISCEKLGHLSDATEYFICTAFYNEYAQFCNRGSMGAKIRSGLHKPTDHIRPNQYSY